MHIVTNLLMGVLAPDMKFKEEREKDPETG